MLGIPCLQRLECAGLGPLMVPLQPSTMSGYGTCASAKADNTTPSVKFLKTISNAKLTRKGASQIAQLRLQHFPLNSFLYKIKRTDKANCPVCGEDKESITHFLLTCPSYAHERWALTRQARKIRKNLTVETLQGDQELAIPLANYIEGTGRFRTNLGEHPQTPLNRLHEIVHTDTTSTTNNA